MSEVNLESTENQAHPDDAGVVPLDIFHDFPLGYGPGNQDIQAWATLHNLEYIVFHPDLEFLQDRSIHLGAVALQLIRCQQVLFSHHGFAPWRRSSSQEDLAADKLVVLKARAVDQAAEFRRQLKPNTWQAAVQQAATVTGNRNLC